MLRGQIIRAVGGFFSVIDESDREYLCFARGVLKKGRGILIVGDRVLFTPTRNLIGDSPGEGVIEKVLPRGNRLVRPTVANIDQIVIVMSVREPPIDWQLISRLLVLAECKELLAVLCLNKIDLATDKELNELDSLLATYPYPYILTSAVSGKGMDQLIRRLSDCCSVFAGPSGVGKSSLLNSLQPGLSLQTSVVSNRIKRGRHTTRQAELITLSFGGRVVDTPGFTKLDFSALHPDRLADFFPEFEPLRASCAFRNCLHLNEPKCAVRREIGRTLNPMRYEHYQVLMDELNKQEVF